MSSSLNGRALPWVAPSIMHTGGMKDETAPLCQYKMMQRTLKMTETLANGYSFESTLQELSNEY